MVQLDGKRWVNTSAHCSAQIPKWNRGLTLAEQGTLNDSTKIQYNITNNEKQIEPSDHTQGPSDCKDNRLNTSVQYSKYNHLNIQLTVQLPKATVW